MAPPIPTVLFVSQNETENNVYMSRAILNYFTPDSEYCVMSYLLFILYISEIIVQPQ